MSGNIGNELNYSSNLSDQHTILKASWEMKAARLGVRKSNCSHLGEEAGPVGLNIDTSSLEQFI